MRIEFNKFDAIDPNDPVLQSKSVETKTKFNLNAGVIYSSDNLFIGLSSTQITNPFFEDSYFNIQRNYYLSWSYKLKVFENLNIIPGFLLKGNKSVWQLDANLRGEYKNKYWVGVGYRRDDAIMFMAGYNLKENYRIGYSYDYTTSEIRKHSHGSHELYITLLFGDVKN